MTKKCGFFTFNLRPKTFSLWVLLTLGLMNGLLGASLANDKVKKESAKNAQSATSSQQTIDRLVDEKLKPINSTKALDAAEKSVVRVIVIYRGLGGAALDTVGLGSGFVVAPDMIVTNYHVIETPAEALSAEIYIVPHRETGMNYQAVSLLKSWPEGDLAILQANGLKIAPMTLNALPKKNETVLAMGYPDITDHLLNRKGADLLVPSDPYVTKGSVALFATTNPMGSKVLTLFHTAPINHGNSGGPLVNECGQVVAVNTWTAPSSLSSSGDVDVSAGQFVATHVSAVIDYLKSANIAMTSVRDACYAKTEDEIIKDSALTRALEQAAFSDEKRVETLQKAEAERALMERLQLAALVILSLLVILLIVILVRKEMRHKEELHSRDFTAPTAFSLDEADVASTEPVLAFTKPAVPKIKHSFPWGWVLLGVIILSGISAFLIKDAELAKRLGYYAKPKTPVLSSDGPLRLSCQLDQLHKDRALSGAGPIDFVFDPKSACVNGRTPYERQSDGTLLRFTVSDNEPSAARLELSSDGSSLTRRDYRLDPVKHQEFLAIKTAYGSLRCLTKPNASSEATLKEHLEKTRLLALSYLPQKADYETKWRCKPQANKDQAKK